MSLLAAVGIQPSKGFSAAEAEPSALDWRILRRILTHTRPYAAKRNTIFALTVARAIQKPAMAWAIAAVINGPITGGDYSGAVWGAAGFFALALVTELTFHFRQRLQLELGEAVVHDLRNDVFRQLQRMPLSYFNKTKLGRILGRVITDIESVRRGVQNVFFFSLMLFGQMAGAAALMLYYNWALFCVLLAVGPLVWLTNRHFHPRLSRHSRAAAESQSRLTGSVAETVKGMRVIQGYARQRESDDRYGRLIDRHSDNNVGLANESSLYLPLLDLHSQVFLAALLVVGGYGALHGFAGMEIGSLIAFFFLPSLFFQSLQHLGNLYTQAITSMAGAERVFQLLDLKPDWTDAPGAVDLPDPRTARSPARAPSGSTVVDRAGARVEFRDLSFEYEPGRRVLNDLSFTAAPGETVALVGHTGSGKTTIVNLIAKFYLPTSGEILIDGQEIRTLRGESLRSQMGIVLQTNFLFTGTVMENIRLGRPDATDAEVRAAATSLDCLDLLESLPQGFATEVGERGTSLSHGQRQLICFTRALLANPRILILDEATSSVDTITESRLQHALDRLLATRTSFVVAHRLSTIRRADQILVLDQGCIVERGPHLQLLAQRGAYHALYRQFALAE
ncbi:MAG: ABC transporter ATP-binding protein [Verrucomicrobia bacterium]|nr:ABC transporter ATP-binding protein [Verrucomicrobiota bacterium]